VLFMLLCAGLQFARRNSVMSERCGYARGMLKMTRCFYGAFDMPAGRLRVLFTAYAVG